MFLIKLLSRIPLPLLYAFSRVLYFITYYVISYRKGVVMQNLRYSFPDKDDQELRAIAKAFYQRFSDFIVESFKQISIDGKELSRRINFVNREILHPYIEQRQSILIMMGHQFNWEWALQAGCINLPISMEGIYQKLSNPFMDKLMLDMRSRFGIKPIEKKNALRVILGDKDRLKAVCIVADQSPKQATNKYWCNFLNQEATFHTGSAQVARAADLPVFFMKLKSPKRGYYDVEFVKLADPPYQKGDDVITERFVKALERLIREDPSGWLWSHKRWKLKRN